MYLEHVEFHAEIVGRTLSGADKVYADKFYDTAILHAVLHHLL